MGVERGLDFAQFNAVTPAFHHLVASANVLIISAGHQLDDVSGAIHDFGIGGLSGLGITVAAVKSGLAQ